MKIIRCLMALFIVCIVATPVLAGPVAIGGDDLDDHGEVVGSTNIEGWLYIEIVLGDMLPQVTRPGNDGSIAVLGAAPDATITDNGGAAVGYAAANLPGPPVVTYYDGAAAIAGFFTDLANSVTNPAIIYMPADAVSNGLSATEMGELDTHGPEIAAFVSSGGGLFTHEQDYGWLTAVIPGIVIGSLCDDDPTLTAAGNAAYPSLTNSELIGACHQNFTGNFGALQVLVTDTSTSNRVIVLGGGGSTILGPQSIPTLSQYAMLLLAVLLIIMAGTGMRKRKLA